MKTKKELGEQITRDTKRYAACEEISNLIDVAIGALRVAKKHQGDVYDNNTGSDEQSRDLLTILYDLASMKAEYQDIASDIADDIQRARIDREILKEGENQ